MSSKIIHRIKKVTGWLLLCLFVVLIAAAVFVYFRAPVYLNKNLAQFVSKKTKGEYQLQFDQLSINFSKWGFGIDKVKLNPVDSVMGLPDSANIHKTYYSFTSQQINISKIAFIKLFLKKELEIGSLEILEPDLKICGDINEQDTTQSNFGSLVNELGPLLRKNIRSIRIKQIELVDANYDFYNLLGDTAKVSNAEHITIGVQNFYTDSTFLDHPDHLFDANDVFIRLANYENQLSDSLHILGADELYYSLKQSFITGKNIRLHALEDTTHLKNRYFVNVPFLKIKSQYIREFFSSDSIRIDTLLFDKAEIAVYPGLKTQTEGYNQSKINLYTLVANDFKSISIDKFLLNESNLKLYNYRQEYELQQELKQLSLEFTKFYLDTTSKVNHEKVFYSNEIRATIGNYSLNLGDNEHTLEANRVLADTRTGTIFSGKITILPISEEQTKNNHHIAVSVECDSIRVHDANLKEAWHFRKLPLGSVEVFKPITTINRYDKGIKRKTQSSGLAYHFISEYLAGVYANVVSIENGSLTLNTFQGNQKPGYIQSGFTFHLTNFALDSISATKSEKLFFASNIELYFKDYKMQLIDELHRLDIDSVHVSSTGHSAHINQLHLYPGAKFNTEQQLKDHRRSELYEVNIPSISLQNTNIHKAFFNKKLTIGNFIIANPDISFENFANLKQGTGSGSNIKEFYELLSNYIEDVEIRQIEARDGKLQVTNHSKKGKTIGFDNQFTLHLENFRLNENELDRRRLLFSDFMDMKIKKYVFKLSDNIHYLQAGEINLSTFESKVSVKDALFYPDITNPASAKLPWNIHVSVPSVQFSGVDLLSFYYDDLVKAEELNINEPEIRLYKVLNNKLENGLKQISLPLPDEIKAVAIGNFSLNGGKIQFLKDEGTRQQWFMGADITMKSSGLKVENDPAKKVALLKSGMFTTDLKNFRLQPVNKNQNISIESISYSTGTKSILVKNLLVAPKTQVKQENQYKMFVPTLQLANFDIDQAYLQNIYIFDEISLDKPEFTFYRNISDSVRFNPYKTRISQYFREFSDEFKAGRLTLNDASFEVHNEDKSLVQKGVDLSLTSFKVDKNPSNRFLHAEQFAFSFSNVVRTDPKKLYRFEFGSINYSSGENHFTVRDIKLVPMYSQERFPKVVGHQVDYFTGTLDEIRFSDVDLPRWFEKQELAGSSLLFQGLNMDVYRDKREKFNENQRPPMPQDLLKNFDLKFYFDSLELTNAHISYSERIEESLSSGKINFSNLKTNLKPFTNIPYLISQSPKTTLSVEARLMAKPLVSAQVGFDMSSVTNQFDVTGSIDTCDLRILNPMVTPAALVEINSGKLNKFEFEFTGDNSLARGKLKFAYDDLKISILEIKDGSTRKSKFSSFLANSLMLRSKNPRGKILLPDEINYQRDPSRAILNYWWKSIFGGAKNTFGFNDNKGQEKQ